MQGRTRDDIFGNTRNASSGMTVQALLSQNRVPEKCRYPMIYYFVDIDWSICGASSLNMLSAVQHKGKCLESIRQRSPN